MFFIYAICIAIIGSAFVIFGSFFDNKKMIIAGTILPCFVMSPVYTFTRGSAGAIVPSDITGLTLLIVMLFGGIRHWQTHIRPDWYKSYWRYIILVSFSIVFIGPIYNLGTGNDFSHHLRVGGINTYLPILMMGFRLFKIFTTMAYLVFYASVLLDDKEFTRIFTCLQIGVIVLSIAVILTNMDIVNLRLSLQEDVYQGERFLGMTKAGTGRLLAFGALVTIYRMYKALNIFNWVTLGLIIIALLFTGSRGGMLVFIFALCAITIRGGFVGGFLGVFGVIIFFCALYVATSWGGEELSHQFTRTLEESSVQNIGNRKAIWIATSQYLVNPSNIMVWLFGLGAMNFSYAIQGEHFAEHAHNDFLTCLMETGILGLTFFCLWLYSLWKAFHGYAIRLPQGYDRWCVISIGGLIVGLLAGNCFEQTYHFNIGSTQVIRLFLVLFATISLRMQTRYSEYLKSPSPELL